MLTMVTARLEAARAIERHVNGNMGTKCHLLASERRTHREPTSVPTDLAGRLEPI